MKKTIITISIILIIITAGFLIYLWTRPQPVEDFEVVDLIADNIQEIDGAEIIDEKLKILSQEEVLGYSINPATKHIYIINVLGEIKKIGGPEVEKISSQKIKGINSIKSSKDGRKILINFNYPNQSTFSIYNIIDSKWTPLSKNTLAADWHPENSNEIIYLNRNSLRILNLDRDKSRPVLNIHLTNSNLNWVSPSEVIIIERPSSKYISSAWLINLSTKRIEKITSGKGLIINQGGGWRLRSAYGVGDDSLSLIKAETNKVVSSFKFKTLASKCMINQDNIYCAVPSQLPSNIILPDDYLSKAFMSNDIIYSFNINTESQLLESKIIYNESDVIVDATDIKIVDDQLYFINRYNQRLYSLKINKKAVEDVEDEVEGVEEGVEEEIIKEASQ